MTPRVLVACPTHQIKEYSLGRWIEAANALTYQPREILLVDNSPNLSLWDKCKFDVTMVHLHTGGTAHQRIAESMEAIRRYALSSNYTHWLSLECDVIAPPDTIETMLDWAARVKADYYCMPCPGRNNPYLFVQNFCCGLFPRETLERITFAGAPANRATDGWFIRNLEDSGMTWTGEPSRQLELEHLANPDKSKDITW